MSDYDEVYLYLVAFKQGEAKAQAEIDALKARNALLGEAADRAIAAYGQREAQYQTLKEHLAQCREHYQAMAERTEAALAIAVDALQVIAEVKSNTTVGVVADEALAKVSDTIEAARKDGAQ